MERPGELHSANDFGGIFESLIEGVQIIDPKWRYLYINDTIEKVSQYTREELIGYTMMEKYPGIEETTLFKAMQTCMQERTPQLIENKFIFPDGNTGFYELSIRPISMGIIIFSIDITEKLKAQQQLMKANRLYAFLSAVNQSIVHIKEEQELLDETCRIAIEIGGFRTVRIDTINQADGTLDLTSHCAIPEIIDQVSRHASIGLNSPELTETPRGRVLVSGEYALSNDFQNDPGAASWKQALEELGIQSVISVPLRKSGKLMAVLSLYACNTDFFDAQEINLLDEAAKDISFALDNFERERRHRETEALVIHNERRFRALIERSTDMKTISTQDGRFIYASPTISKVLGYPLEVFLQKTGTDLIHPDDLPAFNRKRNKILQRPGDSFTHQHRVLHEDGYWLWCESTLTNFIHDPAIQGIVANFRDITENKLAEEQTEFDRNNLNALINSTNDLMWSVDRDFRLITSNLLFDKAIKEAGARVEKGDKLLSTVFSEERRNRFQAFYERAFSGETFTEIDYSTELSPNWIELSFYPIRQGGEIIGTACYSRNITERMLAEENMQKVFRELSDYKYALDESSIIAITDQKGIIRHVNENFCLISKYTKEELIGQDHRIINSGYHEKAFFVDLWRTIASGKTWRGELRNKAKDGSIYWVDTTIVPFLDEQQKPYQYIAIRADISQRKEMEEVLMDSERRLREAQAIAHMGNWTMDFSNNSFTWSEEACRIYGLPPEENQHSYETWLSFVHPDDLAYVMGSNEKARKTLSDNMLNYRIILRNGDVKYIQLRSKFEFDKSGKAIGLYGIAHDITEIKEAEEQIRKSESFNRGVLNALSSHIAVIDGKGKIVAVNQAWDRFSSENGKTTLERTAKGSNYFKACEKSAGEGDIIAQQVLQGMQDVMDEKLPFFYLEYPCHSPEEERWFALRVMKFYSDEPMVVVSHENITELRKTQIERDHTLQVLEQRVEQRTRELVEKNLSILDSINYAKRIQLGLLNPPSKLYGIFPESFIVSQPRDIVSGDFFWCHQRRNKKFIVVADCTGHGVPGALMSIIGNNLLDQIIVGEHIENPSEVLELLDERLKKTLKSEVEEVKDGMDLALCVIDTHFNELYFAGAYRPVFISDADGKIRELSPDRIPIGGGIQEVDKKFETTRFPIIPGQRIYLSSDGYYSQFGGPKQKKFMKSRFIETLEQIQQQSMEAQKTALLDTLNTWMGNTDQVDDIMVVGIEL